MQVPVWLGARLHKFAVKCQKYDAKLLRQG
ncbi:hypothetical protein MED121_21270 [Marinomonas sp. MED121]|nr:hypothetical protein MED121_21270 [Marinomonas sp. MED121]